MQQSRHRPGGRILSISLRTIYGETIPPGQNLKGQILKQGQIDGRNTARNPDLFTSVNLGQLKKLKVEGIMDEYMIDIHDKLELMVAEGNPKKIQGAKDPGRDDLVQSHPNPITEGIFRFYHREPAPRHRGGVRCHAGDAVSLPGTPA